MTIATQTETRLPPARRKGPWLCLSQPTNFMVRECEVDLPNLHGDLDDLRILHISDLHLGTRWNEAYEHVIHTANGLCADLVVCTGDIVDDRRSHRPAMPIVKRLLPAFRSRFGFFTILGNHDSLAMGPELTEMGLHVLSGKRHHLSIGAAKLELIGAPGIYRKHLANDFVTRFMPPARGTPRVVLAHFPDHFPHLLPLQPDLYLCGHTHGGQVCLPGGFPILRHDISPRHLCKGHHRRENVHYIVNQGLGFSGFRIRLFCPPEIVLITLKSA